MRRLSCVVSIVMAVAVVRGDEGVWICDAGQQEVNGFYTECADDYTRYALNGTCNGLKGAI